MRRKASVLFGLVIFLSLTIGQASSPQAVWGEEEEVVTLLTEDWILGDVISVDVENNKLVVGYMDYDTYEERQIPIVVNSATLYENVKSLQDIKAGDAVSIDYSANPQGENTALNISVE
jgi:hypothetical protein